MAAPAAAAGQERQTRTVVVAVEPGAMAVSCMAPARPSALRPRLTGAVIVRPARIARWLPASAPAMRLTHAPAVARQAATALSVGAADAVALLDRDADAAGQLSPDLPSSVRSNSVRQTAPRESAAAQPLPLMRQPPAARMAARAAADAAVAVAVAAVDVVTVAARQRPQSRLSAPDLTALARG